MQIFTPDEYKPDHYSYSQLSSYHECPFSYYLERVALDEYGENLEMEENAFSQVGSIVHELIDDWAKGKIKTERLAFEFEDRYIFGVTCKYPTVLERNNYADKAFAACKAYFENFDGFSDYNIIDTEFRFETQINGRKFVGSIDMILEDKKTGELIILDHKSKSARSFKENADEMYKQQYLYSKAVYERFGRWPDILMFNLFKEGGELYQRKFDKATYDEILKWAEDTIAEIESNEEIDWMMRKENRNKDFFCKNICSARKYCFAGDRNA